MEPRPAAEWDETIEVRLVAQSESPACVRPPPHAYLNCRGARPRELNEAVTRAVLGFTVAFGKICSAGATHTPSGRKAIARFGNPSEPSIAPLPGGKFDEPNHSRIAGPHERGPG